MQADSPCPVCTEPGRPIGRDERGRELFACPAEGCNVVEYDFEVIRRRQGTPVVPPYHIERRRDGHPTCWRR
jgi:hypothetical protein